MQGTVFKTYSQTSHGMHRGLMLSVLTSGSKSESSSAGEGQHVVFLGNTLHSCSASLHQGV